MGVVDNEGTIWSFDYFISITWSPVDVTIQIGVCTEWSVYSHDSCPKRWTTLASATQMRQTAIMQFPIAQIAIAGQVFMTLLSTPASAASRKCSGQNEQLYPAMLTAPQPVSTLFKFVLASGTKEPGRPQSIGLQRVGYDWSKLSMQPAYSVDFPYYMILMCPVESREKIPLAQRTPSPSLSVPVPTAVSISPFWRLSQGSFLLRVCSLWHVRYSLKLADFKWERIWSMLCHELFPN